MEDYGLSEEQFRKDALEYHAADPPGKIRVVPTKPHSTQRELSLAYSPGVAYPCLEIEKDPTKAMEYTSVSYTHLTLPTNREV
mgnify:CR=1 FL=1